MAATGTETVTVACKVPNGLLLRVGEVKKRTEVGPGGIRYESQEWMPNEAIQINGPGRAIGADAKAPVSGGYALTFGVEKALFEQWMKDNAGSSLIVNKQIFAHEKTDIVADRAKEHEKVLSGMEPLNPNNDPRIKANGLDDIKARVDD